MKISLTFVIEGAIIVLEFSVREINTLFGKNKVLFESSIFLNVIVVFSKDASEKSLSTL